MSDAPPARRIVVQQGEPDIELDLGEIEFAGVSVRSKLRVRGDMIQRLKREAASAVCSNKATTTLRRFNSALELIGIKIDRPQR